jgi:hypothetical protein
MQPGKPFSNFWGAIASNGFYARSDDYMDIVAGRRVATWNVPFISGNLLIAAAKLRAVETAFAYNNALDADMSFCQFARDHVSRIAFVPKQRYLILISLYNKSSSYYRKLLFFVGSLSLCR